MNQTNNKANILVVDDTHQNRVSLAAILGDLDQNVMLADSAEQALYYVLKYDFAVILLDVHMPGINGIEAARLIRSREKSSYTPIIFITALHKDEINVEQGYAMGAVDYIFKPISPVILRSKVKVFVDLFTKSTLAVNLQNALQKRQQAEKNLKQLNQRMESILASAGEGIYGINHKGIITFANPAAAEILQTTQAALIGRSIESMLVETPDAAAKSPPWQDTDFFAAINTSKTYQMDNTVFRDMRGNLIPVDYVVTPLLAGPDQKNCQGAVVVFKNISARLQAERSAHKHQHELALAELHRFSSIGEMTSAIAHELNQPLTSISTYVQGCIYRLESGDYEVEQILPALQQASQQAERAGMVLHRIKNFVRKSKLLYEAVNINETIVNIAGLLKETMQEANIQLHFHLSEKMPTKILIDKIQIEQVILNLMQNSVEALQDAPQTQRELTISTASKDHKTLTIHVKDNGPGIKPEAFAKLFELYFTTKAHGMGIGLSICRTIVEAHGGNITAKNNPNGGAWFVITLPIITAQDVFAIAQIQQYNNAMTPQHSVSTVAQTNTGY